RLLELERPPAVVGECLSAEELRVVRWGLVGEQDDDLALHVCVLESSHPNSGAVIPWPTKTASASNSSSSLCVWLVPAKSSSQTMSRVVRPFVARGVDFGLVATFISGRGWKYVPSAPIGFRPAFWNSPAMKSMASSSPRVPGPRPSSRSLARYAMSALIRSAEIAGGASAAPAGNPRATTEAQRRIGKTR